MGRAGFGLLLVFVLLAAGALKERLRQQFRERAETLRTRASCRSSPMQVRATGCLTRSYAVLVCLKTEKNVRMPERSSYTHTPGRVVPRTSPRNCFVGYGELWDGNTVATVRITPCTSRIRAQNMRQFFVRCVVRMKAHLRDSCRHCHVLDCFRSTASMQTTLCRFPFFLPEKSVLSRITTAGKAQTFSRATRDMDPVTHAIASSARCDRTRGIPMRQ
jgi:hypothetical protein